MELRRCDFDSDIDSDIEVYVEPAQEERPQEERPQEERPQERQWERREQGRKGGKEERREERGEERREERKPVFDPPRAARGEKLTLIGPRPHGHLDNFDEGSRSRSRSGYELYKGEEEAEIGRRFDRREVTFLNS